MKPTVYLETSVIGYVTSWPSRDLVTAANQQLTHTWWRDHRESYDLCLSQFVIDECGAGDAVAAQERMEVLKGIRRLTITDDVKLLAAELILRVPLSQKAEIDALHIAVAAVHGIEYLLTWNCKHIANATLRYPIERVCRSFGCEPPLICTPQELMEA